MAGHAEEPSCRYPRSPLWRAAGAHLICIAGCGMAARTGWIPDTLVTWAGIEGMCAAVIGSVAGLAWWWFPINLLFLPVLVTSIDSGAPPLLYLGLFSLLLFANGAAWLQQVPVFPSSTRATDIVRSLLPGNAKFSFIDLGCGTGHFLLDLARSRPDGRFTGIEVAPLPYLLGRWRSVREDAVVVQWGDFWRADFSAYDVVYAYLSPVPMARLWEKARREMRPGSLLVSNGFPIPGVCPERTYVVGDGVGSILYVWRM